MATDDLAVCASTLEGAAPSAAKSERVHPPTPLQGLQDWYLRASDGEWDRAPGIAVGPLEAARAWAQLPVAAGTVVRAPRSSADAPDQLPAHRQ